MTTHNNIPLFYLKLALSLKDTRKRPQRRHCLTRGFQDQGQVHVSDLVLRDAWIDGRKTATTSHLARWNSFSRVARKTDMAVSRHDSPTSSPSNSPDEAEWRRQSSVDSSRRPKMWLPVAFIRAYEQMIGFEAAGAL